MCGIIQLSFVHYNNHFLTTEEDKVVKTSNIFYYLTFFVEDYDNPSNEKLFIPSANTEPNSRIEISLRQWIFIVLLVVVIIIFIILIVRIIKLKKKEGNG